MRIAHEAPMSIMDEIQTMTDYDYCLVHLLEQYPAYLEFFKKAKISGRQIIMDCSLFELGVAFDSKKYYKWLLEIQPDEYIVPDVWQDCDHNISSFESFTNNFDLSQLSGKKIGVLQGKTLQELVKCYRFMNEKADKIAISFGYDYFLESTQEHYVNSNAYRFNVGRIKLINHLVGMGIINKNKPHHLLGCGVPTEFSHYVAMRYNFIDSIDTSHPVMAGISGKSYDDIETLLDKSPQKMVELFDTEISSSNLELIKHNILKFKGICTPK